MICFPNAKINLGLNIVSKREDGYHNLETIFYPIPIHDALEIIESKDNSKDTLIEAGYKVDALSDDNLVMKALCAMRSKYDFPPLEVHLLKNIPFGAGLGGGSSDAAFMLRLINDKFALGATDEELANIAVKLGADCPIFIYNKPMYAEGIGEQLEEINLSLKGYYIVLVKPDVFVSTKDAFSKITPQKPTMNLKEIAKLPITAWKDYMVNDFEKSIFSLHPIVGNIKDELYKKGALYASMSGSGSSVYGIFENSLIDIEASFPDCFTWQSVLP